MQNGHPDFDEQSILEVSRELQSGHQAFMDNTPAAIYVKDEDGRHMFGNRTLLNMFGVTLERFLGTTSHDMFPPELADRMSKADESIRTRPATQVATQFCESTTGEERWWHDVKFSIPGPDGSCWVGGIAIDITEQERSKRELAEALQTVQLLRNQAELENLALRDQIGLSQDHQGIIGESASIREVIALVEQVARSDSTVLLLGETGTGKELVARAIHQLSLRHDQRLVTVNCATLPATLMESELFGCEAGAFTGALSKRIGRFEAANNSTIFLDEVGELPYDSQAKLLRILEEGEFEKVGSNETARVNVRVIAATNRDLASAVHKGEFREDLYYRLGVFPIEIPPLRQRPEDIPLLVWAFIERFSQSMGKLITAVPKESMLELQEYAWPGNVRELRNVIERAMILATDGSLRFRIPAGSGGDLSNSMALEDVERNHILRVLEKTGWRVSGKNGAAELLGLKRQTLASRMVKLGIRKQS